MFQQIADAWRRVEEKLPGFTFVTATFLILVAVGWLILNFVGKDHPLLVIPGFFVILFLVLFVWLIMTIISPPATLSVPDIKWMQRVLLVFVFFLFIGFMITGIGLTITVTFFQMPRALCNEFGCAIPPTPPDARLSNLAHEIIRTLHPAGVDKTKVFSDVDAMDEFLSKNNNACRYCGTHSYAGDCLPDFTEQQCTADIATVSAAAKAGNTGPVLRLNAGRDEGSCAAKKLFTAGQPDRILGIDLSHWDHNVDWNALVSKGVYFVYLKASQGSTGIDPAFVQRWNAAGRAGLIRGAYHTFTAAPASQQAALFLSVLSRVKFGPCDLGPALDIEENPDFSGALAWLATVKKELDAATPAGVAPTPIVYVTPAVAQKMGTGALGLGAYPLWISSFAVVRDPNVPAAWSRYSLLQFTDGKEGQQIDGLPYDVSLFNGTPNELFRLTR